MVSSTPPHLTPVAPDKLVSRDGFGGPVSRRVGDDDLGVKPGEDDSVGRRGALQLEVQELELEQQPASQERNEEGTQEAPPDPAEKIQETRPKPAEGIQEAPSDRKKDT